MGVEETLFKALHGSAGISPVSDHIITFLAVYILPLIGVIVLCWLGYRYYKHKGDKRQLRSLKRDVLTMVIAVALAFLVEFIIQQFYFRPRPFITLGIEPLLIPLSAAACPSSHALASFAVAQSVFFSNKRLGGVLFALALFVSVARMMAGVHYPLDIVGGAVLGIGAAFASRHIVNRYFKKGVSLR